MPTEISPRPRESWEQYFIGMAKSVSRRSSDPSTQHGCVISSADHRVISVGYNGPLQGIDDSQIPTTRPDKYFYYLHSEENCILFANKPLRGCYAFITGHPCHRCARMLMQAGIVKIVYGGQESACVDDKDKAATRLMARLKNVELIHLKD